MENATVLALVAAFGVGFTGLVLWMSATGSQKIWRNGQRLAETLGLTPEPGAPKWKWFYPAPRATGTIRGKRVELFSYTTGAGKSRRHWVAISAAPSVAGSLTLSLARQGLATRVLELFGAKEVQVGDPAFDQRWFIRTNQPDFVRAALLPELRLKLAALDAADALRGSFELKDGVVKYAEEGSFYDDARCSRFAAVADVVCDLADIAEVWAQQPS